MHVCLVYMYGILSIISVNHLNDSVLRAVEDVKLKFQIVIDSAAGSCAVLHALHESMFSLEGLILVNC